MALRGGPRLNDYFIDKNGISREVIQADICRYLGNDALVRPGNHNGRDGYFIRAYRNLTSEMITDLQRDSEKYEAERQRVERAAQRITYEDPSMLPGHPGGYPPQQYHDPRREPAYPPGTYDPGYPAAQTVYPTHTPPQVYPPYSQPQNPGYPAAPVYTSAPPGTFHPAPSPPLVSSPDPPQSAYVYTPGGSTGYSGYGERTNSAPRYSAFEGDPDYATTAVSSPMSYPATTAAESAVPVDRGFREYPNQPGPRQPPTGQPPRRRP